MNKNQITMLIALGILAGGAYLIYKEKKKHDFNGIVSSKENVVNFIVTQGKHGNAETLMTFDDNFLKTWAAAIFDKKATFSFQGKNYNTQGGKAI